MSKAQTQVVESKAPEFIMTKAGFMVVGHELIGDKMTALICEAVNSFEKSGLTAIVLRNDGYPKQGGKSVFGIADPDTNSISINLERHWDHACTVAEEGKKHLSFMGILWTSLISTIGHELDHLVIAASDRELYEMMRDTDNGADLEVSAKESERQLILTLARDFDTEIPAAKDMGYFGVKWMELLVGDDKDLAWVKRARDMVGCHEVYNDGEGTVFETYRQFVKNSYDHDDLGWDQPTNPINLVVYMDGQDEPLLLPAEPVAAPVVEQVAVAEKIEAKETDIVMTAGSNAGLFVGAGVSVGSDGPEIVLDQADETPHELAADQVVGAPEAAAPAELNVPMAPAVAAQQEAFAAAATMPATPEPATTYAPNSMDPDAMRLTMEAVWQTLYHHLFTKCGWSQNPSNGHYYFASGASILEHVNIQHILSQYGADNFIMEYDTLNAQGQGPLPEQSQGTIRGHFSKKDNLPCYTIYLNINGMRAKRTLMPQNPEKLNAQNAYTNPAVEAQQGHQIAWVFNADLPFGTPFNQKCIAKITNTAAGINYERIA